MIPLDDRGLLLGDGLFETLLWREGRLDAFEAHVRRLQVGCDVLGLPHPDTADLETSVMDALGTEGLGSGRAAVRVNWTVGSGGRGLDRPAVPEPRLFAVAFAAPDPAVSVSLATVSIRRNEGSPLSRVKSLSYLDNVLARREAKAAGADEALMLNNAGEVACAAAANLFWFEGRHLVTPALACGVLAGTMRARVIARADEAGIGVIETRAVGGLPETAKGLFLTNSLIGVQRVAVLDGRSVEKSPLLEVLSPPSSW